MSLNFGLGCLILILIVSIYPQVSEMLQKSNQLLVGQRETKSQILDSDLISGVEAVEKAWGTLLKGKIVN